MNKSAKNNNKLKDIIVVILLLVGLRWWLFFMAGVVLMWIWTNWYKWIKILIVLIPAIVIALGTLFSMRGIYFDFFRISGSSMLPNFKNGEYVYAQPVFGNSIIKRGDVIIFLFNSTQYIGRAIALPRETITIQEGSVYINGNKLNERNYLSKDIQTKGYGVLKEGETITLSDNQYFILNDNRSKSKDSRNWGPVSKEEMISKSLFCVWHCLR